MSKKSKSKKKSFDNIRFFIAFLETLETKLFVYWPFSQKSIFMHPTDACLFHILHICARHSLTLSCSVQSFTFITDYLSINAGNLFRDAWHIQGWGMTVYDTQYAVLSWKLIYVSLSNKYTVWLGSNPLGYMIL